ncbi:MAG: phosphohydrolase [Candidatus Omnitrophica bacterium]|nr:phosphohydrolase [Candidatus Omnitrophota bacterium]
MIFSCPGSARFKQPEPRSVSCPSCGRDVEVWTDETSAECQNCKIKVTRDMGQSCFDWCAYAKICAGYKIMYVK